MQAREAMPEEDAIATIEPGATVSAGDVDFKVPRARAKDNSWVADLARVPMEPATLEWPANLEPWMVRFLNALAFRPVKIFAIKSARVSNYIVDQARENNPTFKECYAKAMEGGWDRVEEAAHIRAVDGVEKAIFDRNGQVIGTEVKYSDGLAELLLRGNRPEKYRDKQAGPAVIINTSPEVVRALDELFSRPAPAPRTMEAETVGDEPPVNPTGYVE